MEIESVERLTKISAVGEHLPQKPLNLTHKSDSSESNLTEIIEKLGNYEDIEEQGLPNRWIPCSERLPECCGYPVLLTVENGFNQRHVCKAFTNYMKEGKLLFLTNEKEYCEELISSKLSNAWKPIAWMPLPEPYGESEGADGE